MIYSPRHQILFCGSRKGEIALVDLCQRQILKVLDKAHDQAIKSLALDARASVLISGSADGSVKVWNLTSSVFTTMAKSPTWNTDELEPSDVDMPVLYHWQDVHKQQTLVRPLMAQSGGSAFFTQVITT